MKIESVERNILWMASINGKEFLDSYHHGQAPYSFGGKQHVKDYVNYAIGSKE